MQPEVTKRVVGTCPACLAEVTMHRSPARIAVKVAGWRWLFLIAAGCFVGFTLYFLLAASPHVQQFNTKETQISRDFFRGLKSDNFAVYCTSK